jgi:hypothetical protein
MLRTSMAPTIQRGPLVRKTLQETIPVFPISKFISGQLYYDYQLNLSGTSGVLSRYVISANGAFDPNITGTGHQPMGFDQMMLFYEQATVVASSIRVLFSSSASTDCRVAISLTPDTTTPVLPDIVENGLIVMDRVVGSGGTGNAHTSVELELHCDVAKYFGRSHRELITSPEFYSTAAANPTEQVYFQICCWNPSSATTYNTFFDVVVSYDIFYYEPRKTGPSLSRRVNASQKSFSSARFEDVRHPASYKAQNAVFSPECTNSFAIGQQGVRSKGGSNAL